MAGYNYAITDIEWDAPEGHGLPGETNVILPSWLVCADGDVDDSEWEEVINERLLAKHGHKAKDFGFTLDE
ncbi:hypothetical protein GRI75_12875 [Altererythrobacter soli]|uniref:Uncharacterized protein n=1 Tax=Croceibacterium soli TaxID=1739690 RepID=A0A6I4UX89_9SPHN|nr:hypothetical protein [Croceibacterium soli]MXP42534.1 hypothetical protein [Croceibacterium soli]